MKNHFFTLIIAFLGMTMVSQAQTSQEVLDKLSVKAKAYKTITSDFNSTLNNSKAGVTQTTSGTIKVKGSKYYVSLGDYQIWCDGKTVWHYSKADNSVTIDDLEDMDDGGFDPSKLFTVWEQNFKHAMHNPNAKVGSNPAYEIALNPNNPKNKSYHTIFLFIDKAKMEVSKVEVKTRENATISYEIKSFKTNTEIPDATFTFSKSKFPGVEEVDNRI